MSSRHAPRPSQRYVRSLLGLTTAAFAAATIETPLPPQRIARTSWGATAFATTTPFPSPRASLPALFPPSRPSPRRSLSSDKSSRPIRPLRPGGVESPGEGGVLLESSLSDDDGGAPSPASSRARSPPPADGGGESDDPAYWLGLAIELRRAGDLPASYGAILRASNLLPDSPEISYQRGMVLADMGRTKEAADAYRGLMAPAARSGGGGALSPPPSPVAAVALASILLDGMGDRGEGEVLGPLRRVCASGPGPASLLCGLAHASSADAPRRDEAAKYLEEAVRFDPRDVDAVLHLMICKHGEGDRAAADGLRKRLPDAVAQSWDYVLENCPDMVKRRPEVLRYFTRDMIDLAADAAGGSALENGLVLEFGVFYGKTLRMIVDRFPTTDAHGFDTFGGLPEDWRGTKKGAYSTAGVLPDVTGNVSLHQGLFSDSLPKFLEKQQGRPVRFVNVDCDLYSSTKDVLDALGDLVISGTVLVFDEYVMNPRWQEDEYRAFQEAVEEKGWNYEYLGISLVTGQAVVRIL